MFVAFVGESRKDRIERMLSFVAHRVELPSIRILNRFEVHLRK